MVRPNESPHFVCVVMAEMSLFYYAVSSIICWKTIATSVFCNLTAPVRGGLCIS